MIGARLRLTHWTRRCGGARLLAPTEAALGVRLRGLLAVRGEVLVCGLGYRDGGHCVGVQRTGLPRLRHRQSWEMEVIPPSRQHGSGALIGVHGGVVAGGFRDQTGGKKC